MKEKAVKKPKYTVGQRVMASAGDAGPAPYLVTKVGRTWVYVQKEGGYRERAFAADSGYEKGDYTSARFYTEEAWADRAKQAKALDDLKSLGVASRGPYFALGQASSATLRKIIDLLEEES